MWKSLLKLASGIIVLGASVVAAVAATGVAGDGMVETFGSLIGDAPGPLAIDYTCSADRAA